MIRIVIGRLIAFFCLSKVLRKKEGSDVMRLKLYEEVIVGPIVAKDMLLM